MMIFMISTVRFDYALKFVRGKSMNPANGGHSESIQFLR